MKHTSCLSKNEIVSIHNWLDSKYGSPKQCEDRKCEGKSKVFEWCLRSGKKYERKRRSFRRLCRSCHRKYDWNLEKTNMAVKNLWWRTGNKIKVARGEEAGSAKLTSFEVKQIRAYYKDGVPQIKLAEVYGVRAQSIWRIVHNSVWRHI